MSVELNHTIVHCRDKKKASAFLTDLFNLPPARPFAHFLVVELANGVSLDFDDVKGDITSQHYAFLISESEFDAIFDRVTSQGIRYWADPGQTKENRINRRDKGRGFYFENPDGHLLEVLTRPYGSAD